MNEVKPIKTDEDYARFKMLIEKHKPQIYSDIWTIGCNVALRITDLLNIEYDHIIHHANDAQLTIREQKTGKLRLVVMNKRAAQVVAERRLRHPGDRYLFQSHARNVEGKRVVAISRIAVSTAFKEIGDIMGIPLSTHSMRKTWGYKTYKQYNDIALVQKVLNHSTPATTLRYIGIDEEEIIAAHRSIEFD